jgi:hypothetical protein
MNMVRWQNPNPSTPACRVKSIVLDEANLWSAVDGEDIDVDYTPPVAPAWVHDFDDGTGDKDTVYFVGGQDNITICGSSSDINSGVANYYFGMGAYCFDTTMYSIASSPDTNNNVGFFVFTGDYYTFAFSVNGAGLISDTICSDGFYAQSIEAIMEAFSSSIQIFPNPVSNNLSVVIPIEHNSNLSIYATDGRQMLFIPKNETGKYEISCENWARGIYLIKVHAEKPIFGKFVKQ